MSVFWNNGSANAGSSRGAFAATGATGAALAGLGTLVGSGLRRGWRANALDQRGEARQARHRGFGSALPAEFLKILTEGQDILMQAAQRRRTGE